MSQITLNINFDKNTSLQVGDIIYYETAGSIKTIGPVTTINTSSIVCEETGDTSSLANNSFIFFGKDNEINTSGIIGYYAEVQMKNESTSEAEIFAVNSEIFLSSN
jgi:hypothetical protein